MRTPRRSPQNWTFFLVLIIYALTRLPGLGRELAYEEYHNFIPGREWLLNGKFVANMGELSPYFSPFHKPFLLPLVGGLFSFWGPYPIWSVRLLPFLAGLLMTLLPLLISESIWPSILLLISPFAFAGASHIQIDPTFGVFGTCLFVWGLYHFHFFKKFRILGAGIIILWMTKVEISIFVLCSALVYAFFISRESRRIFLRNLIRYELYGILSLLGGTLFLGSFSAEGSVSSLVAIFKTIQSVVFPFLNQQKNNPALAHRGRQLIIDFIRYYSVPSLICISLIPTGIAILKKRISSVDRALYASYLTLTFLPFVAYLAIAFSGDGFPRYFLICLPPLTLMMGLSLQKLEIPLQRLCALLLICIGAITMLPKTWADFNSPGSPNTFQGFYGMKSGIEFLNQLRTEKMFGVVVSDSGFFYLTSKTAAHTDISLPEHMTRESLKKLDIKALLVDSRIIHKTISTAPAINEIMNFIKEEPYKEYVFGSYSLLLRVTR